MKIKPFRAIYPNFDFITSPDTFCENAKEAFNEYQENGFFEKAPQSAFYIYQIESEGRTHTGLVALNDVGDFTAGKVKKHEKTLSEREQHQMQLFLRWNAILKPVLLTYPPVPAVNAWLESFARTRQPIISTHFERDGQDHRIWAIEAEEDIQTLQDMFAREVPGVYIADGHHRTSTIALLHERLKDKRKEFDFSQLFCAFFGADQLDILDYNRVAGGLKEVGSAKFIVKLSKLCDLDSLEAPRKPQSKYEMIMYMHRQWYSLHWKPKVLQVQPPGKVILDANLLNELVFRDILGIMDVRTDTRMSYVDGSRGLDGVRKAVDDREDRIGFVLYPVDIQDMMQMADAGESLPPKSTYFEPRLKSGMLVKPLRR